MTHKSLEDRYVMATVALRVLASGGASGKTVEAYAREVLDNLMVAEGVLKFGCHLELDPGQKPNECVIDEGTPHHCMYATNLVRDGKTKWNCPHWKEFG